MKHAILTLVLLLVPLVCDLQAAARAVESEAYIAAKAERRARRIAIGIAKGERRHARVENRKDWGYYVPVWIPVYIPAYSGYGYGRGSPW